VPGDAPVQSREDNIIVYYANRTNIAQENANMFIHVLPKVALYK